MREGRHQTRLAVRHGHVSKVAARRRRRRRAVIGGAAVLLLGGAAFVVTQTGGDRGGAAAAGGGGTSNGSCSAPATVSVAVADADAAPMEELAAQLASRPEDSTLPCANLTVVRAHVGDDGVADIGTGVAAVYGGVGQMSALEAGLALNEAAVADRTAVATTLAVLAMPRPMAQATRWDDDPASWSEIASTVLDPDSWADLGRPEFGAFSVSLANPAVDGASRAALVGLAAGASGTPITEITAGALASSASQDVLLALHDQAARATVDETALLEALTSADVAGALVSSTSVAFLDERTVWEYNAQDPTTALVAVYPEEGAVNLDMTWSAVQGPGVTDVQHEAVVSIGRYLLSEDGQELLAGYGLRRIDDVVPDELTTESGVSRQAGGSAVRVPPAVLDAASGGWVHLDNPGRFLVAIDVSGSMSDVVGGTGRTKLQFAQEAAVGGMKLVPWGAEIGLWEFATGLDGAADYNELVSLGGVSDLVGGQPRIDRLVDAVNGLTPRTDTALYDTALAAFHSVQASYQPGEPNVIILITDGRNDDPSSISLDALLAALTAEQDPDRPVRLITLGYGADADTEALAKISEATGGAAFSSPNPADIGTVFFQALNAS